MTLKRTGFTPKPTWKRLERKARIAPMSKRRERLNRKRARVLEEAWGPRPWKCTFLSFITDPKDFWDLSVDETKCHGPVNAHELLKRSRSGRDENLTEVSGMVALCDFHNGLVEDRPGLAEKMGLAKPSGRPVKSVPRPGAERES